MRLYCQKLLKSILLCFLLFSLLFQSNSLQAQNRRTFRGTVTNGAGEPVAGASVVLKGETTGTATDNTGTFSINAAEGSTIVVSSVGFTAQEHTLRGTTPLAINLSQTTSTLNDVVVLAYGTQRRRDITGSVAIVDVAEAKKFSTNNVAQLLQGRATGVQVTTDGEPGANPNVRIRGIGTFGFGGSTQPLYVIDGVQVGTVIRDFSPNDIESIQVLKDASAAALYGSQAANGVIIITTKQGRKNATIKVDYNGYYGIDKVWQITPVTDRATYQMLNNEARKNAGRPLAPGNNPASPVFISNIDTDWQKEGLKTGNRQNHNIGFSGGGENNTYNFSVDYFNNEGTYVGNGPDYTRYTVRLNSSFEKGRFKIGENVFYAHSTENALMATTGNDLAGALPPLINTLVFAIPTMPIYDPKREGGFAGTLSTVEDVISMNGIGLNSILQRKIDVDRIFSNVYAEAALLKNNNGHNLRYRLNLSYDKTHVRDFAFKPAFDLGYFFQSPIAKLNDNGAIHTRGLVENTLTYQKAFGRHGLEVLAGQSYLKSSSLFRNGYAEGFNKPYQPVLGAGGSTLSTASAGLSEYAIASYLGRINYNFDDRYLLTLSGRRDASSRFAKDIRVGYFPAIALAWRLTHEKFINLPKNIVTDIKLRGSYGKLGNDNIGDYRYQPVVNSGVVYTFNGVRSVGGVATVAVDENIKWEDRTTSNIGVDAVLLNGNLDFTAEYYSNKTVDALVEIPINLFWGYTNGSVLSNAGTLKNSGVEFTAAYHKRKGDFTYDISANLSTIKNKVLSLGSRTEPLYGAGSRTIVGSEVGEHFGFVYDGIFQTQAEVTAHAVQFPNTAPGDIRFKDISGPAGKPDNRIDDYDREVLGSAIPKYNYGFGFNANYKKFDFSLFASGSAKYLINSRFYRDLMHTGGSANYHQDMVNRWTPTNTNTTIPRLHELDPNNNGRNSNRPGWLQDGTYLRINTLALGYNISPNIIKGITRFRVYLTAQNLYTFTKYQAFNPDFTSGVLSPGYDEGSYPRPRTIMAGVQLGF